MLRIDPKWGEDAHTLLQKSLKAEDFHMRRRLLALHFVASGVPAKSAASRVGVDRFAVSTWVHRFNSHGLEGLKSRWSGRPGKILTDQELSELKEAVCHHPREIGLKRGRWSKAAVAAYIKKTFGKKVHPDTARKYLHLLGFGYRKPDKDLCKGDPDKQKEFAKELEKIEKTRTPRGVTVYMDQGIIYQDVLQRKGWFLKGESPKIHSTSPGKKKILFYSAVVRPLGKVITMQVDRFFHGNTARFIQRIRQSLPGYRIDLIWDGASWHKGRSVQKALSKTRIHAHRLPGYSPMMNAAEYFIRWSKEVLAYNFCWKDLPSLKYSFRGFVASMARRATEVLRRCRPQMFGFGVA